MREQENDATRSRRELFDRHADVFDAVTKLDVVGAFGIVRNAKLSEQTLRRFGAGRIA